VAKQLKFQESLGHKNMVLPEKIHDVTENEFHGFFCLAFKNSSTRPDIDSRYSELRQLLTEYVPSFQIVFGCYVESEIDPEYANVVICTEEKYLKTLSLDTQNWLIKMLYNTRQLKEDYRTDVYPCIFGNSKVRNRDFFRRNKDYHNRRLFKTSSDTPKGVVSLKIDTPGGDSVSITSKDWEGDQ